MVTPFIVASLLMQVASGSISRQLETVSVETFQCNREGKRVSETIRSGDWIRVCVEPTSETMDLGITTLKINDFDFFKEIGDDTIRHGAINAGNPITSATVLSCEPWADNPTELCTFQTLLRGQFFETDGEAQGVGTVAMVYMEGGRRRELQVPLSLRRSGSHVQRQTKEFAGMADASLTIKLSDGLTSDGKWERDRTTIREHWNDQETHIKGLYVGAVLVLIVFFCCIMGGMIFWGRCCADVPGFWVHHDTEVDEDSISKDMSETHSIDDDEPFAEKEDMAKKEEETVTQNSESQYDSSAGQVVVYDQRRRR